MNTIDRNEEIHQSFISGAKAFALGAVLILVMSTVDTPAPLGTEPVMGYDGVVTPAIPAAAPGTAPDANARQAVKFGDVPVNKVAPDRGDAEAVPVFVGG